MEGWVISLLGLLFSIAVAIVTYVATIVTVKNKTEQNNKDIDDLKKLHIKNIDEVRETSRRHNTSDEALHSKFFEKLDIMNETITEHKTKLANAPTMEQVRVEFVSKEMFKQMEKHIDEKFDKLESGIEKILNKLDNGG